VPGLRRDGSAKSRRAQERTLLGVGSDDIVGGILGRKQICSSGNASSRCLWAAHLGAAPDRVPLLGPALKRLVQRDAMRRAAGVRGHAVG
jgi:hypothetical protein